VAPEFDPAELPPTELALYQRWEVLDKPPYELGGGATVIHLGKFMANSFGGRDPQFLARIELWLSQLEGQV